MQLLAAEGRERHRMQNDSSYTVDEDGKEGNIVGIRDGWECASEEA